MPIATRQRSRRPLEAEPNEPGLTAARKRYARTMKEAIGEEQHAAVGFAERLDQASDQIEATIRYP